MKSFVVAIVIAAGIGACGTTAATAQSFFSVANGSLCAQVDGGIMEGANLILATCNGGPAQRFEIDSRSGKIYVQGRRDFCVVPEFTPDDWYMLVLTDCKMADQIKWSYNDSRRELRHATKGGKDDLCWFEVPGNVLSPPTKTTVLGAGPCAGKIQRLTGKIERQFAFNVPVGAQPASAPPAKEPPNSQPQITSFFRQSDQPAVYLQYASDLYCHVQNEHQMAAYGGFSRVEVVPKLQLAGRQTGTCGWPNGFFRRDNESAVYRLHGPGIASINVGNSICHVVNERQMAAYGGFAQVRVINPASDLGRGRGSIVPCPNP